MACTERAGEAGGGGPGTASEAAATQRGSCASAALPPAHCASHSPAASRASAGRTRGAAARAARSSSSGTARAGVQREARGRGRAATARVAGRHSCQDVPSTVRLSLSLSLSLSLFLPLLRLSPPLSHPLPAWLPAVSRSVRRRAGCACGPRGRGRSARDGALFSCPLLGAVAFHCLLQCPFFRAAPIVRCRPPAALSFCAAGHLAPPACLPLPACLLRRPRPIAAASLRFSLRSLLVRPSLFSLSYTHTHTHTRAHIFSLPLPRP